MSENKRIEQLKKGAEDLENFALNFKFPKTPQPQQKKPPTTQFKRK